MADVPTLWWPTALLALALLVDALVSIRPPAFVQGCLDGVALPRDWWWALIVIKMLAAAGLVAGLVYDGIGLAANVGVVAYFLCAGYAHIRARFLGQEFWLNCLGMLSFAVAVLTVSSVT